MFLLTVAGSPRSMKPPWFLLALPGAELVEPVPQSAYWSALLGVRLAGDIPNPADDGV